MAQTLEGTCPALPLDNGCKVVIEARDPTSGAAVASVTVSNINIYGLDLTGDAGTSPGDYLLVPGPQVAV